MVSGARRMAIGPGRGRCLAGALLCLAGGAVRADAAYVGEAREPAHGTLIYEEHHLLRPDAAAPRERLVLYRCGGGAVFARKHVEYGAVRAAPSFALEDVRFGYREGVQHGAGSARVYTRPAAAQPERSAALPASPRLVIDAGFDEFVRQHWQALQRGDTLALDFLVPSRLEALGFKLRRSGATLIEAAPATRFRLSLGGLLGFFAGDIEVSYRDADRRLMQFEGVTNIRAGRDDNIVARITFPPARERSGIPSSEWQAALAEPLESCRPGS
jgi:hypothetical protein